MARFRRGLEGGQVLDVEVDEKQFSTVSESYALVFSLRRGAMRPDFPNILSFCCHRTIYIDYSDHAVMYNHLERFDPT